jgi:hypothetical protein
MGHELPRWVREAAEFEPDGDTIVCRWGDTEWVMSPAVSMEVELRIARANAEWRHAQRGRNVAAMRKHPPGHG